MVVNGNRSLEPGDWFDHFIWYVLRFASGQTQVKADAFNLTQFGIDVEQERGILVKSRWQQTLHVHT